MLLIIKTVLHLCFELSELKLFKYTVQCKYIIILYIIGVDQFVYVIDQ